MKAFKKQNVEETDLQFIQDNVDSTLRGFKITNPIMDGVLLENVTLVPGTNSNNIINHGLGRKLIGWFLVRNPNNERIFDSQDTNDNPTKTLILNSTSSPNDLTGISIWVF